MEVTRDFFSCLKKKQNKKGKMERIGLPLCEVSNRRVNIANGQLKERLSDHEHGHHKEIGNGAILSGHYRITRDYTLYAVKSTLSGYPRRMLGKR